MQHKLKKANIRIKKELSKARLFFKEKYGLFIEDLEKKANEVWLSIRATKIDVPKILTVMCYIRAYSKNIG